MCHSNCHRRSRRLWIASVEYNEDVRLSETILQRIAEAYRKLRNTLRFMLGTLTDGQLTLEELQALCRGKLGGFQLPLQRVLRAEQGSPANGG